MRSGFARFHCIGFMFHTAFWVDNKHIRRQNDKLAERQRRCSIFLTVRIHFESSRWLHSVHPHNTLSCVINMGNSNEHVGRNKHKVHASQNVPWRMRVNWAILKHKPYQSESTVPESGGDFYTTLRFWHTAAILIFCFVRWPQTNFQAQKILAPVFSEA